mmetsp:Transcript_11863/g.19778  ORF Transcript_11863/g.19778 Transcript_11863/m.19778 type:complete len:269 (-) Transcript_11863:340-1146(-)
MMRKLNNFCILLSLIYVHFKYKRDVHVSKSVHVVLLDEPLASNSCPLSQESIDLEFPIGFPQNLTFGRFRDQTGFPFITQDFWADIVDNRRTFFLRPKDNGFPSMDVLRKWIQSRPHPITLVFNNNHDRSWPENIENKAYELLLDEENLHQVFAGNVRNLSKGTKLKPIPIGFKWQWRSTLLFGEEKKILFQRYSEISISENESKKLFLVPNRTDTVWMRPMMNSNKRTQNYERNTDALKTTRVDISGILKKVLLSLLSLKKMVILLD